MAHPGTSVLGGARPPPQSGMMQSSQEPGTYHIRLGPEMEEVQPERSVLARARRGRREATITSKRMAGSDLGVDFG